MSEFYTDNDEYEEPSPSMLEILAALTGSPTLERLSYLIGDNKSDEQMTRSVKGIINYPTKKFDPVDNTASIVTALTSNEIAEEILPSQPSVVTEEVKEPAESTDFNTRFLRHMEQAMGWSPAEITTNADGSTKSIVIHGNSEEFQGLGKYRSPEEFIRANPEGFRAANPLLAARMEREQQIQQRAQQSFQAMNTIGGSQIIKNLQEQIARLNEITDRNEMFKAVSDIEISIARSKQDFINQAKQMAEAKLGIPTLTEQLRQNEALDRQNPLFFQNNGKDSIETAMVRRQLQMAEKAYASTVKEMIAQNPIFIELDAVDKLMSRTAQFRMNRLEKEMDRAELAVAKVNEKYTQIKAQLGSNVKYLPVLFPESYQDPAVLVAQFEMMDKKTQNSMLMAMEMAETNPSRLPLMAISGLNPFAGKILLAKEREANISDIETMGKLAKMEAIFKNPIETAKAIKELKAAGYMTGWSKERMREFEGQMAKFANPVLDKALSGEQKAIADQWRMEIAQKYVEMKKIEQIDKNLANLNSSAARPAWLSAIAQDPKITGGKPLSLDMIISYINTKDSFKERSAMLNEFKAYYGGAMAEANKSSIGQINVAEHVEKIKVKAAQNWLQRSISRAGRAVEEGTRSFVEAGAPLFNQEILAAFPLLNSVVGMQRSLQNKE